MSIISNKIYFKLNLCVFLNQQNTACTNMCNDLHTVADSGFGRGGGPRSFLRDLADIVKRSWASEVTLHMAGGLGPALGPQKL